MFSMNSLATKQQNMRGDYFEQDSIRGIRGIFATDDEMYDHLENSGLNIFMLSIHSFLHNRILSFELYLLCNDVAQQKLRIILIFRKL